jgi:hypothetical protein
MRNVKYESIDLAKDVYRDEDGEATEESLRAFKDKWQRAAIAIFTTAGALVTLSLAVLSTLKANENQTPLIWLQFGVWVRTSASKENPKIPKSNTRIRRFYSPSKLLHFSPSPAQPQGIRSAQSHSWEV